MVAAIVCVNPNEKDPLDDRSPLMFLVVFSVEWRLRIADRKHSVQFG
jgi:hypothetical protein